MRITINHEYKIIGINLSLLFLESIEIKELQKNKKTFENI